jgi:hypothetical protein
LPPIKQFSATIGESSDFLRGRTFLLEVNPAASYERVVASFTEELTKSGCTLFIFTYRASPVYKLLAGDHALRFFVSTPEVSYLKKTDRENEILVPQSEFAVTLDLVSKTIESSKGDCVAFVFDSLSDNLVSSSFESTYKFLKSVNEVLAVPNVSALFLMTRGIHDSKIVATMRSQFPNHLVSESEYNVKLVRKG